MIADTGSVNVVAGSTLDFSGASGGGAAGSLTLSAPEQTVQLAGAIKGGAAAGFLGGSFSLNTGGAVDLDNLAIELASSGVNDSLQVQTNAGNLVLSAGNTLTAHQVSLIANGGVPGQDTSNGAVQILGTINANGNAGGEIDLFGKSEVDVEGMLLARACATGNACGDQSLNPSQRGGTVNIGTTGTFNGTVNATFGNENIDPSGSGTIILGTNMLIDVSGGTAGGLSNGTVNLRAPLLDNDLVNVTVAPAFQPGKGIVGSRATTLEAYGIWSTTDPTGAGGAATHFDGIVDPAGDFSTVVAGEQVTTDGQPISAPYQLLVSGTFTDQSGNTIKYTAGANGALGTFTSGGVTTQATALQIQTDLNNDFFTPTMVNTDHQLFFGDQVTTNSDGSTTITPGTLMKFVEQFPIDPSVAASFANANVAHFAIAPGIELDNRTRTSTAATFRSCRT
ncbi:MAG: hypothetical protein WDN30_16005 [Pararobbsia sp.]